MAARLRGGRRTHSSEHKACPRGGSRTCAWSSMCRPSPPCTGNPPQHAGPSASRSRSTKTLATWRVVWRFPKRRLKRERRNLKKSEDPEWMQKTLHLDTSSHQRQSFFSPASAVAALESWFGDTLWAWEMQRAHRSSARALTLSCLSHARTLALASANRAAHRQRSAAAVHRRRSLCTRRSGGSREAELAGERAEPPPSSHLGVILLASAILASTASRLMKSSSAAAAAAADSAADSAAESAVADDSSPEGVVPSSARRLEDEYDVFEVIGHGHFATVRRGRHRATGMEVAIKELKESGNGARADAAELRAEIDIRRRMGSHPNIGYMYPFPPYVTPHSPHISVFDSIFGIPI